MKLTKIAFGISVGLGGLAANAADVAMFPHIVHSSTVTTVVTLIDRGNETTISRYDTAGKPSLSGGYLHWRLNYKVGTETTNPSNSDPCKKAEAYLPTATSDIISVDLGAELSDTNTGGAMFNDFVPGTDYALAAKVSKLPLRGVLFVHNSGSQDRSLLSATADYSANSTVQGEAMVFEFQTGAAWGYSAETKAGGSEDDAAAFSFADRATGTRNMPIVSFIPSTEVNTILLVTPVDSSATTPVPMLGKGGGDVANWDKLKATIGFKDVFDRDGIPVSGAVNRDVTCVGALTVNGDEKTGLLSSAAQARLTNGGYGTLSITNGRAIVYKLEYGLGKTLSGKSIGGTYNQAWKL